MRTLLIILDGLCEYPLPELSGVTPLEAACTPAMDYIARHSRCVRMQTCPADIAPATDCCVLTLLGYDINTSNMPGRGYIEAYGAGLRPKDGETVYRCNFVKVQGDIITEALSPVTDPEMMLRLIGEASAQGIRLHPTSPGHALAILPPDDDCDTDAGDTPLLPNQLIGCPLPRYCDGRLNRLAQSARDILGESTLLFWGGGRAISLPALWPGSTMITAVDVMKGLASIAGMTVMTHPSFTGDDDTNYQLKTTMTLEALAKSDSNSLTLLHIEAPDTVSHLTHTALRKKKVIEDIDNKVISPILSYIKANEVSEPIRLILTTDHYTDCSRGLHHCEPIPMAIYSPEVAVCGASAFNESAFANAEMIR